ncbi:MAG: hypothetical protein K2P99_01240, partial [Burkholderiales bacterium]|nr:hypothetical protein [Burkholderiales bacterium]
QSASPLVNGVQLFMPLSNNLYLCAYDSKIYKYGSSKNLNYSYLSDINDINWLNKLQIDNATSMVGFSSKKTSNYIMQHAKINSKTLNFSIQRNEKYIVTQNYYKQLTVKPSFFKILKKSKKLAEQIEYRNPSHSIEFLNILSQITSK